jgi:hypothetical protein
MRLYTGGEAFRVLVKNSSISKLFFTSIKSLNVINDNYFDGLMLSN